MTTLDRDRILSGLTTSLIGRNLLYFPTIGSTQDMAREVAARGAPDGTLVIADAQTAGRGRLGRRWVAPPGSSLLMSLLLRPPLAPTKAHQLTMVCSLAIVDAVAYVTGLRLGIKWPNDIVTVPHTGAGGHAGGGRKLAGLLTESGLLGERLDFCIVGMGINVNLDVADLPETITPATSLSTELGRAVNRLALLHAVLMRIETRYLALREAVRDGKAGTVHQEWTRRLATLGQRVVVTSGETALAGIAEGVDEDGSLLLRTADGRIQQITVGDVTLRESPDARP